MFLLRLFNNDSILLPPDVTRRLKIISDSAQTSPTEMLMALIYWAFYRPHADWDKILKLYRDRKNND